MTRRFRAGTTIPYVHALAALARYAREHQTAQFTFGPVLNVSALQHNGLTISGPEAVVEALTDLLEREAPGLAEVEA